LHRSERPDLVAQSDVTDDDGDESIELRASRGFRERRPRSLGVDGEATERAHGVATVRSGRDVIARVVGVARELGERDRVVFVPERRRERIAAARGRARAGEGHA